MAMKSYSMHQFFMLLFIIIITVSCIIFGAGFLKISDNFNNVQQQITEVFVKNGISPIKLTLGVENFKIFAIMFIALIILIIFIYIILKIYLLNPMQNINNEQKKTLELAKKKLEKDYQYILEEENTAKLIFDSITNLSSAANYKIYLHMNNHSIFGGDFIFYHEDQKGILHFLIGDFTGHGLSASIGILPVSEIFFHEALVGDNPKNTIKLLNSRLKKLLPQSKFCAACYIIINPGNHTIQYWNGAIPYPLLLKKDVNKYEILYSKHMALGILSENDFSNEFSTLEYKSGDILYAYTDGILEEENREGEIFGKARLHKTILDSQNASIDDILLSVKRFTGNKTFNDDVTLATIICP